MYQVIARKYRPQSFHDVVNQEHVKSTIENAIAQQRIAHGYIFSGQRGTGKTTVARIVARCLNCIEGPTTKPCGKCASCLEVTAGNAVDVIAHSLGGVIVFDAATTATPTLHVRRFITFGSQASFFQVLDPRTGLATYIPKKGDGTTAKKIPLPPTIGTWLSLWEPLDPLAFLAGSIFTLSSQETPTDEMVPHAPAQLWTHSEYWTSDFVVEAIRHALCS